MIAARSTTLALYIARQFATWFAAVCVTLFGLIFLAETAELLRRAADHEGIGLGEVLRMAALKAPYTGLEVLPFAVLVSAMGAYWRMSRSNELVVARSAGLSVWQFLIPTLVTVVAIAAIRVTVLDPLAAAMLARYDRLQNERFDGGADLVAATANGLWLREADRRGEAIIHADRVVPEKLALQQVTILNFAGNDRFVGRVDAASARLEAGHWALHQAWITRPNAGGRFEEEYRIPTTLSFSEIADSFSAAKTVSFWDLPHYIKLLEETGFSARSHRLQFYRLLAMPLLFAAMVLLAATFSLRQQRAGGAALLVGAGALSGFLLYFLSDIVFALGLSSSLPLVLAAWTPAGVSAMLGIAMLLHLEDG